MDFGLILHTHTHLLKRERESFVLLILKKYYHFWNTNSPPVRKIENASSS